MGYYILGIIIFLLAIIFVSDLIRSRRDDIDIDHDDYVDTYATQYRNQYYGGAGYFAETSEEVLEKELAAEEGKVNDMGVEPIYQNVEHQALEANINYEDKELEDVLPEDPDANDPKR